MSIVSLLNFSCLWPFSHDRFMLRKMSPGCYLGVVIKHAATKCHQRKSLKKMSCPTPGLFVHDGRKWCSIGTGMALMKIVCFLLDISHDKQPRLCPSDTLFPVLRVKFGYGVKRTLGIAPSNSDQWAARYRGCWNRDACPGRNLASAEKHIDNVLGVDLEVFHIDVG